MPQNEPLSPPLLAVAGVIAAVPAAWLALAAEAVVSGAVGALAGFHWTGLALSPSFTLRAELATQGDHAATLWAVALLAGPAVSAVLALGAQALVEAGRWPAWVRVVALELLAFAWLRLPVLLFAGSIHGGRGPVTDLYARLGEPQAGRWPVMLLAVLMLAAAAALVGRRTVGTGREWMRADGRRFRQRLVRVLAGYPALTALALWSVVTPWAAPVWIVLWLLLSLPALHVLVS